MAGTAEKAAVKAVPFAVVTLLVGALTAGCSGDLAPPAGPGPTSGSRTSLAVPAVTSPLDVSVFRDAPCDLLSERRASELGLPFAERQGPAGRMACKWRADKDDPNSLEALTISLDTDDGLTGTAQICSTRTDCDSWTVDTIAGYPVIRANGPLESKYGFCQLFVGVADNMSFTIADGNLDAIAKGAAGGDAGGPRCDRADRAATMVIQTLKEGR